MNELFQISESFGPLRTFINRHNIETHYFHEFNAEEGEMPWSAYKQGSDLDHLLSNTHLIGEGSTEREAIIEYGRKLNLEGWDKISPRE